MATLTELNWPWIESQTSCPLECQNTKQKKILLARLPRGWNLSKEYRKRHRGRLRVHSRNYLLTSSVRLLWAYCGKCPFSEHTFFWNIIHTYTEKRVECSYTISMLLESFGVELWRLENGPWFLLYIGYTRHLYHSHNYMNLTGLYDYTDKKWARFQFFAVYQISSCNRTQ